MKTFVPSASDAEIRALVVEWSELLASKRFDAALEMFPPDPTYSMGVENLEEWISNYGSDVPDKDGTKYEITSLTCRSDAAEIIGKITVDRENLFGLNPAGYVGMVHYDDVPLNGERSDLTARFNIKRVGGDLLTLEFLDIHVL